MKYIIIFITLLLSACSSTKPIKVSAEQKYQSTERYVSNKVEVANMQKHGFCNGDKLQSYVETRYYYMWTCSDGRNFMIPKQNNR